MATIIVFLQMGKLRHGEGGDLPRFPAGPPNIAGQEALEPASWKQGASQGHQHILRETAVELQI